MTRFRTFIAGAGLAVLALVLASVALFVDHGSAVQNLCILWMTASGLVGALLLLAAFINDWTDDERGARPEQSP